MWVAMEPLLNLQRQPLHATTHVRVARRDPDPTSRRNGDHDRSAFNVAAINDDEAFAPIRIRASFISTRIAPTSGPSDRNDAAGAGAGVSFTITGAKPHGAAAPRASRRHL